MFHRYIFSCNKWLAEDRGDGKKERLLKVSTDDKYNSGAMLRDNLNRRLFEDHLWLSVAYRKSNSSFTRVQRLSCCLALLYLTMVANAMWYKTGEESSAGVITLGPISLSIHQLYASFMSSIIVFPPILILSFCFVKSSIKQDKQVKDDDMNELHGNYYTKQKKRTMEPKQAKQAKKFMIPYWFIYIGWILVFLSVFAGAFFTILYSFEWGGETSSEWLIAFFLSFFESLIIIQPSKVHLSLLLLAVSSKAMAHHIW